MNKLAFQRLIVLVGILLFVAKLIAWKITRSDAVFSDAVESIVNIVSAFLGMYSITLASKPKDLDHPYGHGKVEFLTSGLEGFFIIIAGIMIIAKSVNSFISGNYIQDLDWGILIVLTTGIINYTMGWYSVKKGEKEKSPVLIASGNHLKSDTITSVGIVISLIIVYFTDLHWVDSLIALIFGSYIIFMGYPIIRRAISGIMDESDDKLLREISSVLSANRKKEWIDIHNVKIQQYGANIHIDAHITLPWYYSLREAHNEMEKVIIILAKNIDYNIEFNFHMDDCKPTSCQICKIEDCPERKYSFKKSLEWTVKEICQTKKHFIN